jgi:hypothetical protein
MQPQSANDLTASYGGFSTSVSGTRDDRMNAYGSQGPNESRLTLDTWGNTAGKHPTCRPRLPHSSSRLNRSRVPIYVRHRSQVPHVSYHSENDSSAHFWVLVERWYAPLGQWWQISVLWTDCCKSMAT